MKYGHTITTNKSIIQAKKVLQDELVKEGLGQLFEIPFSKKLNEKLNLSLDEYHILGVCHPPSAYRALAIEKQIGLFLPCTIIVYSEFGTTHVATMLPSKVMNIIDNPELDVIAKDVELKLIRVINRLV